MMKIMIRIQEWLSPDLLRIQKKQQCNMVRVTNPQYAGLYRCFLTTGPLDLGQIIVFYYLDHLFRVWTSKIKSVSKPNQQFSVINICLDIQFYNIERNYITHNKTSHAFKDTETSRFANQELNPR